MAAVTNVKRLKEALEALHGEAVKADDVQRIQAAYAGKHRPEQAETMTAEERAGVVLDVLWQEVTSTTLGEEAAEAMATAQAAAFGRGIG